MTEPRSPQTLILTSFSDERGHFSNFWKAVKRAGVPSPATRFVDLHPEGHSPRFDTGNVLDAMRDLGVERAFVRTEQKAAPRDIDAGSMIAERTPEEIQNTVESLLVQHSFSVFPTGDQLVVRELLDLDFCMVGSHDFCHPEVRYIIEDGEVLFTIGRPTEKSVCARQYDHLSDRLQSAESPDEMARKLAAELDDATYAIDFVMDTRGDWYALEAGLNGVRWDEERGCWRNMCGHGDMEEYSPRETYRHILDRVRPEDTR